ncbi:MAG: nitrate reductase, partial [Bacillota bacterium]
MSWLTIFFGWFSVFIFLLVAAYRIFRLAAMPLHLRWELYPVAHEPRPSGGSYMEEVDYVQKPRHFVLFGEIKELLSEVFILKRV